uniref:GH18 domain-containing protein n=1 Tax=Panagrolaimus sp. PS1159 TaxID=55785 RepID=A0AC35F4C9_9BILA
MILKGRESNDDHQGIINFISLNVKDLVDSYDLDGIELIWAKSMNAENLQNIITNIRTIISKDIEIGLQINVFKNSELFVDVMNSVTWVTHKINPLSDAALAIFYQWNNLYENFDLDLKKVLIKVSPAVWQQNAIFSFDGKYDTKEKEDPGDDVILNRKYLCLNETINQNLPPPNEYLNLPIIFSIQEKNPEKVKENLLKNLNDPKLMLAVLSFQGFRKPLPRDLYYMRYETKEIIEYKIKIAERFGFGGIAFDSITNDDFEEICGTSLFKELIKIFK